MEENLMARTTAQEVKAIMVGTGLTYEQLQPFVDTAEVIVTEACSDYGEDLQEKMMMWLAAHLACSADPEIVAETMGAANVTYSGRTDLGLNATSYGQKVLLMDRHGYLNQNKKISMNILADEEDA
jgi:hypothetical protein